MGDTYGGISRVHWAHELVHCLFIMLNIKILLVLAFCSLLVLVLSRWVFVLNQTWIVVLVVVSFVMRMNNRTVKVAVRNQQQLVWNFVYCWMLLEGQLGFNYHDEKELKLTLAKVLSSKVSQWATQPQATNFPHRP